MIRGIWARKRHSSAITPSASANALDRATQPVLEHLEARQMLSANGFERHSYMGAQLASNTPAPAATHGGGVKAHSNVSAATVALRPTMRGTGFGAAGANQWWTVDQIRHLYGLDQLDAANASFPLYTNTGAQQTIAIVASDPGTVFFSRPNNGTGNLTRFSNAMGVPTGGVVPDRTLMPGGGGGGGGGLGVTDIIGAELTSMVVEWTHAMAPGATIILVEIPTANGVATHANLQAGIQLAINDVNLEGGGVVMMPFTTNAEDPTIQAQYDAIFNQASTKSISFIGAAGDNAGVISMPAASPKVTSVGGTVIQMDALGNRNSETAWVRAGGGPSLTEPFPAFQSGIVPQKAGRKSHRGTPDLSLGAIGRATGYGFYYDPTVTGDATNPWSYVDGTMGGAAVLAGMVADANELRYSLREGVIGQDLNNLLYQAYRIAPTFSYTDITLGNNTHQAGLGYDFATGLGVPAAQGLIPSLGGVVGSSSVNTSVTAQFIDAISTANDTAPLTTSFTGTGNAIFGPFDVGVSFALTSKFTPGASATITIPLFSRNLNGSVEGQGTAHVVIPGTTNPNGGAGSPPVNTDLPIFLTGTIGRAHKRPTITGQFYTIDANGKRVAIGNNQVFQGSFKSI